MKKQILITLGILTLILSLSLSAFFGCGSDGVTIAPQKTPILPTPTEVPTIPGTRLGGSAITADSSIGLSGVLNNTGTELELTLNTIFSGNQAITDNLTAANFTITEVKNWNNPSEQTRVVLPPVGGTNITPVYNSNPTGVEADIIFFVDTTTGMKDNITTLSGSLAGFDSNLSGLDVNYGLFTFGSSFDTVYYNDPNNTSQFSSPYNYVNSFTSEPQTFEGEPSDPNDPNATYPAYSERPALYLNGVTSISDMTGLLNDAANPDVFLPSANDPNGGPENCFGTIYYAMNEVFETTSSKTNYTFYWPSYFRDDALKIFVVISDSASGTSDGVTGRWTPPTLFTFLEAVQGSAVIHSTYGTGGHDPENSAYALSYATELSYGDGTNYIYGTGGTNLSSANISSLGQDINNPSVLTWIPKATTGQVAYFITVTYNGMTGTLLKVIDFENN